MKIMITGGAGYIGNELVYRLSAEPSVKDILVYDNLVKSNYNLFTGLRKVPGNNVRFTQGDILDSRTLKREMEGMDVLVHLASRVETPLADQNPHGFEQTNHWGTAEVVYAVEEAGVQRVLHLSSQSVYGQGEVAGTDHPRAPSSYYAISTMRGEDHLLRLMEKLPVQLIRCADVYGYSKNLRFETMVNRLLFDAHFTGRVAIHGDPDHTMTHISLYRVVEVLARMILRDLPSDTYNLSHRQISVQVLVESLKELYPDLETIFVDQHLPQHDIIMSCDPRLAELLPGDTTMVEDLVKFRELFTF